MQLQIEVFNISINFTEKFELQTLKGFMIFEVFAKR